VDELLSVMSLHALVYCERLFYLEEVERIRIADAAMFAGRRVHVELARDEEEEGTWSSLNFESHSLGLRGTADMIRRRSGAIVPYEHKRGRSAGTARAREAWQTDRVQVAAYALLAEEAYGQSIVEARVRYHADNVTVAVQIDEPLRAAVLGAVERARALRNALERPPVASNERLCTRCSLAPVCLPEEARLAADPAFRPVRTVPEHPRGKTLHVMDHSASVGRRSDALVVHSRADGKEEHIPVIEADQVVLHGFAQISTQALRLCADAGIGVHWMTQSGGLVGSLTSSAASPQRQLRQFAALTNMEQTLALAKRLVRGKLDGQLRWLLRATRGVGRSDATEHALDTLREMLRRTGDAENSSSLLGIEGNGAAAYFRELPQLISSEVDERLRPDGRSRRPTTDRFNTLLSYGYGMLYREVVQAIVGVGLHPGVGFYHRARTSAQPLALDVMELFRVPMVDMALVGAVNRRTFDADADFHEFPGRIALSESGRRKVIEVVEHRKQDTWRHSVVGYSLSYARMIELEVRLLEKEWMGEGGLFAGFRLR
jgi:CRISP-associated protein Cas1